MKSLLSTLKNSEVLVGRQPFASLMNHCKTGNARDVVHIQCTMHLLFYKVCQSLTRRTLVRLHKLSRSPPVMKTVLLLEFPTKPMFLSNKLLIFLDVRTLLPLVEFSTKPMFHSNKLLAFSNVRTILSSIFKNSKRFHLSRVRDTNSFGIR